jgi:hypothetical protein
MALARSNPIGSTIANVLSGVLASGAGFLAADLWHRFSNTYDPAASTQPTNKFTGGDGTAANAKNIALPPDLMSIGGQAALTLAPLAGIHFAKVRHPHVKAGLYGFAIGAGAHLLGQGVEFGLVKLLGSSPWGSRLFPQEIKAAQDHEAKNFSVSGTLGGHPPFIEELHTMFPHVPKHLLHSFGIGYGPSYSTGPYALQPGQPQHHHPHHQQQPQAGVGGPPPPPPPPPGADGGGPPPPPPNAPMTPAQPLMASGAPGGSVQLTQPCPTPESRNANLSQMFQAGQRELSMQNESMGLGRLPSQMNPDRDPRDID